MITGWLPLYLRARRVTIAAPVSLAAIVAVMIFWSFWSDNPRVHPSLATLTLMFALSPLIPTLAGHDDELDRTAAMPWPPRRALHLVAIGAVVAGGLLGAHLAGIHFGTAGQIARNSIGLAGLIGLGAALLGTLHAAVVPIIWTAWQAIAGGPGGPAWQQSLLWLAQPAGSVPAAVTAATLVIAGTTAYAIRVGPPRPPSENALGH
ncbi:hypothetical protein Aph02nite_89740 [Actinoplanes philippinensis]|uniref:ABC-2 family transporter protein n=1 Tax=Actinoplanes philippinensis TaxID=35752 RepID=A0A1I2M3I3_9ACTN|nr:hypothetical protein [Actinoplanes philippinensis]GIE83024.1 hypothetical protein Aph02nite_89740 [Actinoplanes philippinensis]SFF86064.1 hypothetical protein SAMN05421541_12638 [Actinoplanes philippinensis]